MKGIPVKLLYVPLIIVIISGCKKNIAINSRQELLFQVEYINYAWGYQHNGFIIDNEGNILKFENPENWHFHDKDFSLSEDQVKYNLERCINSGIKISPEELKKYAGYIKNISLSKVTALKNVAADAGTLDYICYQFSDKSGIYKGFLIKKEGDFTCENLNFYSKRVVTWLKSINDTLQKIKSPVFQNNTQ